LKKNFEIVNNEKNSIEMNELKTKKILSQLT
jgi:hypothetical protein